MVLSLIDAYSLGILRKQEGISSTWRMNKKCSSLLGLSFWKKEFLGEGTVASEIELGEVQPLEEPVCSKDIIEPAVIESHPEPTLRRSGRVSHQSSRYYDFLV